MTGVGISDTITDIMLNGPAVADPNRGAVALEGSAPMTPERIHVVPLLARDGSVKAHALVSEVDAERVLRYPWCLNANGYAWRNDRRQVGSKHTYLHRMIVSLVPGDGLYVDHINRDKLDNRRANLRIVTPAQSRQNTPAIVGLHRGVTFSRDRGLWVASVQLDGRRHHVGRYRTEAEASAAARAWRLAHMPFTVEDIS
jgi:hypothetical protein